ncbi:MAG: glycosyltransferase family 4 protein [Planctomycetes bacterium]|nr:glycosyltransferase family 4 protein [Planctomycetota bacterium]
MPAKRRVLLVMESTIGGTRRHLNQLATLLPRDRFDITVAASAERDATFRLDMEAMRKSGADVVELPMVRNIDASTDRRHVRELRALMRNRKFDIVHAHSSKAGALARYASWREGVGRRVFTPHTFGFAFAGGFSPWKRAVYYCIERALGKITDRIICVSPSEAAQARRLRIVAADRIRTVENGIDPKPYLSTPDRASARKILKLPKDGRIVCIVALLNSAKGQLEAVEAMAAMPADARPLLYCIGGVSDAAYGAAVKRAIEKHKLHERVLLIGHRDDVPLWLAASDFVLCPSRWEGMPYAVLEAMAAGRAVVATMTNGARDAIEDAVTGWLVPVGDTKALAAKIGMLLSDPDRRESFEKNGRERVLSKYSIENMIQKTAAVYDEVLEA